MSRATARTAHPQPQPDQDRAADRLQSTTHGRAAEPCAGARHERRQREVEAQLDRHLEQGEQGRGREQRLVGRHELRVERDHEHRGLRVGQLHDQPLGERLDRARAAVLGQRRPRSAHRSGAPARPPSTRGPRGRPARTHRRSSTPSTPPRRRPPARRTPPRRPAPTGRAPARGRGSAERRCACRAARSGAGSTPSPAPARPRSAARRRRTPAARRTGAWAQTRSPGPPPAAELSPPPARRRSRRPAGRGRRRTAPAPTVDR